MFYIRIGQLCMERESHRVTPYSPQIPDLQLPLGEKPAHQREDKKRQKKKKRRSVPWRLGGPEGLRGGSQRDGDADEVRKRGRRHAWGLATRRGRQGAP